MKVEEILNYFEELMKGDSPDKECPLCKRKYGASTWSISRKDNNTEICCRCGLLEGLKDYYKRNEKGEKLNV